MIGYLHGRVLDIRMGALIVDVGGIGYSVHTTADFLSKIAKGEEVGLSIHTAVREDDISLYGFSDKIELDMFESLLRVSGIGPKSALAILSVAGVNNLEEAIASGDTSLITKVSGVGRKTADKIVLELGGQLHKGTQSKMTREDLDVFEALQALGYRERDIQEAMKNMPKGAAGANDKIREALKMLGK